MDMNLEYKLGSAGSIMAHLEVRMHLHSSSSEADEANHSHPLPHVPFSTKRRVLLRSSSFL